VTSRLVFGSGAIATALAVVAALAAPGFRSTMDLRVYDALLRRSAGSPSDDVALVVVDDASIAEIGQWPWPRDALGRMVDSLHAAGASVLAFDILLSEPDRSSGGARDGIRWEGLPPTDAALARALDAPRVVMGHAFTFEAAEALEEARCGLDALSVVIVQGPDGPSPVEALPRPLGSVCSLPAFTAAAGAAGFLNAEPDPDGIMRRVPLLMAVEEQVYPSLALAAVVASGVADRVTLEASAGGIRLMLDETVVPLDVGGSLLVRYQGGVGTFPRIQASDVLLGRMPEGAVRDRVVFVGATALGLRDVVATPFAPSLPGLEVHGTVASSLLEGSFMRIPPWAGTFSFLGSVLGGLGAAGLAALIGLPLGSAIATVGTILLWLGAVGWAEGGVFVSPVLPTMAVVLAVSTMTVLRLRQEEERADEEQALRERTHEFTIESLTGLIEVRDASTGEHVRRTRSYVQVLASALKSVEPYRTYLTPDVLAAVTRLAPLHDIGKIGIEDAILRKPDKLTEEEYAAMKRHPELGYRTILRAQEAAGITGERHQQVMRIAEELVYTHHERWDGKGYPRGLSGEDIPVPGRIMAVVDVYDALVGDRVYQASMTHEDASAIILRGRGTSFDPAVVDAFLRVEREFRRIAEQSGEGRSSVSEGDPIPGNPP
jgi:adenylate cyclase